MTAAGALAVGRRFAEAQMRGRCTLFASTKTVTDRSNGQVTHTDVDPHPGVHCRVRPGGVDSSSQEAGGQEIEISGWTISVPVGHQPVPKPGQRVRITAYPDDPSLVGRVFKVRSVAAGDITARRLGCDDAND